MLREKNVLVIGQDFFHRIIKVGIADSRTVQARKQISDESQKQRHIIVNKLDKIVITEIADGSK